MSYFHNGRTPYFRIEDAGRLHIAPMDDAAALAGVSRQTLARWCDAAQRPPVSAVRLFQVCFLGLMPWDGWQSFRAHLGRDDVGPRWLLVHDQVAHWWTPERLLMIGHGYDRADALQQRVDLLQETVTALSTRQPPPIPCAEIIPFPAAKKSPA